jgi:hypothetical protein
MEDRNEALQRQPASANASSGPGDLQCEAWSTPVLIHLNAAAGTDKVPVATETASNSWGPS